MHIYSYLQKSRSSAALAKELGIKRIKHRNSNFVGGEGKVVLNWGASNLPEEVAKCKVINPPDKVAFASNKLNFFHATKELDIAPAFTESKGEAIAWLGEGYAVVCRTILNGHSGEGIVLASTEEEIIDAPLYVRYVKKTQEYRVHVMNNRVIDVQRKARRIDIPDDEVNWQVRNHANGFIFARNNLRIADLSPQIKDKSLQAIQALGLDFGAVDIVWNQLNEKAYVLEVNTAPGLEGTTLETYANAINHLYM